MTKLYLITGFLGAGKTTFLRELAKLFATQKICILVNEFGKEDVDSKLLRDLQAHLEEIHNGSIFCSCRLLQFEQTLMQLINEKPDVILVETSGLSDPSNIKNILSDSEKYRDVQYMGCICLADAVNFEKVYTTALAVKKQLFVSDVVLLNKTDLVENTVNLHKLIEQEHPGVQIFETQYGKISADWINTISQPQKAMDTPSIQTKDLSLQSYVITISDAITLAGLLEFLNGFASETYRIKGFAYLEGQFYLIDCVGENVQVTNSEVQENCNHLVVLSGQGMKTLGAIKKAAANITPFILSVK